MRGPALLMICLVAALMSCTAGAGRTADAGHSAPERVETVPAPAPAPEPSAAAAVPAGLSLPAPSTLQARLHPAGSTRTVSYTAADLKHEAEAFDPLLPHQRITPTTSGAEFDPGWLPGSPDTTGLSFAMYAFSVQGYAGDANIFFSWLTPPGSATQAYLALADWDNDVWDWYPLGASPLNLPEMSYIDFGGALLACVLCTGTDEAELDWLRLGSLPPSAVLTADFTAGLAPLAVSFDATGSSDPDGSIVDYSWDPDGDGVFDQSTGSDPHFAFEYSTGGTYPAAVRATDDQGVYGEQALTITPVDSINFSIGAADFAEEPAAVLVGSDHHILLVAYQRGLFGGDSHPFVAKLSPAGQLVYAKGWQGSGEFSGAALGPDNSLYVCGYSAEDALGSRDALLQKWTTDGELIWSKNIGDIDGQESLDEIVIYGDTIYVCGTYSLPAILAHFGFLARLDLDGNLLWASTLITSRRLWFHDLAVFRPNIINGTTKVYVVGEYWPADADADCIYAVYDTSGNQLDCSTWGETANLEYGQTINTTGNFFASTTVTAIVRYPGGADSTMIGHPGDTTLLVTDAAVSRIIPWSMQGLNVGLIKYGSRLSIVQATFDSALNLIGQAEITAVPDGSCVPDAMTAFGDQGYLFCGLQYSALPAQTAESLTVQTSGTPWNDITLSKGSPSQLVVADKTVDTLNISGLELNRNADDGDALLYLLRNP